MTPLANGGAFGGKRVERGRRGRPAAGRRARTAGAGAVRPRGRRAPRTQAPSARRRRAGRRDRRRPRRPDARHRRRDRGRSRPDSRWRRSTSPGPPTSAALRGAGWAEAAVLLASLGDGPDTVVAPNGATATATLDDGGVHVRVRCGDPLDEVVLRSYCTGAAHMALGWVRSEGLAVDAGGRPGRPHDPLLRHHPPGGDADGHASRSSPTTAQPVNGSRRRVRRRRRRGLAPRRAPAPLASTHRCGRRSAWRRRRAEPGLHL